VTARTSSAAARSLCRFLRQLRLRGLGDAEIDDLGDRQAVVDGHQDVGRLEVAVDDALLMRVLDGLADFDEEVEPFASGKFFLVAVIGDFDAAHQFHDEVRATIGERSACGFQ